MLSLLSIVYTRIMMVTNTKLKKLREELATAIRRRRKKLKLSQEDVAEKAKIDRTYVSRLENGRVDVSVAVAYKVALALKTTLTKIIKETMYVTMKSEAYGGFMIKAYLERMNRSEILLVMIGGMATVAGAVLAAYIGFLGGDDEQLRLEFAKHLLAASVMAAPGAIVVSKILYPQTEKINTSVKVSQDKIGANILDAIANGTTEGLKLAVNVGAMLLVFVAFIAMTNGILGWIGDLTSLNPWMAENTHYPKLSLESILGTIFAPLMWLIGVAKEDMMLMGQLLGVKLVASEFIGYIQLSELKDMASTVHLTYNKSVIMATYMLCGFHSNRRYWLISSRATKNPI